jgi:2-hydroxychromene-2-carboxylate isomerase
VPAPAVIPAPIAYINAAAVKKLVVGYRAQVVLRPFELGPSRTAGDQLDRIKPFTLRSVL